MKYTVTTRKAPQKPVKVEQPKPVKVKEKEKKPEPKLEEQE